MASFEQTSRDQIEGVGHLFRRALRYTGLAVLVVAVGAALSVAFALSRGQEYQSETTLLYQQLIPDRILEGRAVDRDPLELAARYRELALSRSVLQDVIEDLDLHAEIVADRGMVAAVEEMRERVTFEDLEHGVFHLAYVGNHPEEARRVTERLAEMLVARDDAMRQRQADVTNEFLEAEKRAAATLLERREQELAAFVAENPKFAEEMERGSPQGAWARALRERHGELPLASDERLAALERQRGRLQARLESPQQARDRERRRAEARVDLAERALAAARSELESALGRYTEQHPDVAAARKELAAAQRRLREAESTMPETPADGPSLVALHQELQQIERQIADRRRAIRRDERGLADPPEDAHWVVELETEFARHLRDVEEARERVDGLERRLFAAQIRASSEIGGSSRLAVIDEAFEPARPVGPGRRVIAAAGTMLFGGLAIVLLFGLALVDDRLYGRGELDRLGIGSLTVVVPDDKRSPKRS